MSEDPQTLSVYDSQSAEYEARVAAKDTPGLKDFIAAMPAGGRVLDLGCGPGLAAKTMLEHGLEIDAVDGSSAMVTRAIARGVPARQALFHEITGSNCYHGIFANFSLLHLPRSAFPNMLIRLQRLLTAEGILHIGMKLGDGENRDRLGRFYSYYQPDELDQLLTLAGFTPITRILGTGAGLDGWSSEWIVIHARR